MSERCQVQRLHTGKKFLLYFMNWLGKKIKMGWGTQIPNHVIHTGQWIGNKWQEPCVVKVSPNLQEKRYRYSSSFTYKCSSSHQQVLSSPWLASEQPGLSSS